MVMLKHGIPLVPAELLRYHMGLIVPKTHKKYFWNPRTGKRPPAGYGTQAGKKYSPNAVFRKLNIPLKMSWSLISKFKDSDSFRVYLGNAESSGKDILLCFDWPSLFEPKNKDTWGHVCLLDKVYIEKDEIRIIDPDFASLKWRTIKIEKIYGSMKLHGKENSGGFWELEKI